MPKRIRSLAAMVLCAGILFPLSGCRISISIGTDSYFTGESYPNAENYQTGAFSYHAGNIKAIEVYWRSGEVEITESDNADLNVGESGSELPEESAMHWFLEDGVLRIRFCASGARIRVNSSDKRLHLEVPKNISLSVHTTSAAVRAGTLEQKSVLISAHSGKTELDTVTADRVDLSSSSGSIRANCVSAQSLKCSASSGSVMLGTVSAKTLACDTSSGAVSADSIRAETVSVTASSGSVKLGLPELPKATIRTSSGKVVLTLPAGGAEVSYHSTSGRLRTDRAYERRGDLYVFDKGEGSITVQTASGDLRIQ